MLVFHDNREISTDPRFTSITSAAAPVGVPLEGPITATYLSIGQVGIIGSDKSGLAIMWAPPPACTVGENATLSVGRSYCIKCSNSDHEESLRFPSWS